MIIYQIKYRTIDNIDALRFYQISDTFLIKIIETEWDNDFYKKNNNLDFSYNKDIINIIAYVLYLYSCDFNKQYRNYIINKSDIKNNKKIINKFYHIVNILIKFCIL